MVSLNKLAEAGYLAGGLSNVQGGKWRQALVRSLAALLRGLGQAEVLSDRRILGQLLRFIPAFPAEAHEFAPPLIELIDVFAARPTDQSGDDGSGTAEIWSHAHVLGSLLRCTEKLLEDPRANEIFRARLGRIDSMQGFINDWTGNREVLGAVARLVESWRTDIE